jgi:tetratricopeptide (TPR) repeat protein
VIRKAVLAASLGLAACATAAPPQHPPQQQRIGADAYGDFLVGRVANLNADYGTAAEHFQAALMHAPADEDLLDSAVAAALSSGDAERARQIAQIAPAATSSAYAQLVRSVEAIDAGHWRNAQRDLAAAHGGAAEQFMVALLMAWADAGQGRITGTSEDLQPLLSVRPYGSLLYAQQAMIYDLAGRNQDALSAYGSAAVGGLWSPLALVRRCDLMARTGARDQALALLNDVANAGNPDIVAAAARLQAGRAAAATPLTPARGAAISLAAAAAIYLQQSASAEGLAALTLALMLDPDLDAARVAIATQQNQLGHRDAAISVLHAVTENSDYASSARVMEAWVLVDEAKGDDAVALAERAARGGDLRAERALGDIYRTLHRYVQAEAQYNALIGADPGDWRLYFARGAVRMKLNRVDDGEADLQHALSLSPNQPDVLNYLGYSWIDRGVRLQEALAMIERAVALRPDSGAIADSLGWAYYRMGDYERARDALEHAVDLDPGDATLNEHLGDVYWRVGRRTEARYQWRHALGQSPDDADALQTKLAHGLAPVRPARR